MRFISTSTIRLCIKTLPQTPCIFTHSTVRQRQPKGGPISGNRTTTPAVNAKKNLDGENNYVWMEATGQGHFVGVTMSILQNQDGWWGEGDDMFFVDGEKASLHQRHRIGRLLSRSLGLWRASVLLRAIRSTGERRRACGQPLFRVSVSSGFADPLHHISQSDDRAWPCQSSLRQLFFGRVLVPEGAACRLSCSTPGRAAPSAYLSGGRSGKCREVVVSAQLGVVRRPKHPKSKGSLLTENGGGFRMVFGIHVSGLSPRLRRDCTHEAESEATCD